MRKFKVVIVDPLEEGNQGGEKYMGKVINLTPIISNHYELEEDTFRCIEHKKGSMKLISESFLLNLREMF